MPNKFRNQLESMSIICRGDPKKKVWVKYFFARSFQTSTSYRNQIKTFILRNIQLPGAYKKVRSNSYTYDQYEIYRLETLDFGQWWLVLNPFPNNKYYLISFHILYKQCDLKVRYYNYCLCLYTVCTVLYFTKLWLTDSFNVTVLKSNF